MKSDRVVAILKQARHYVERGWCQKRGAAMRIGPLDIEVEISSCFANRFCALGALRRSSHKHNPYRIAEDTAEYRQAAVYLQRAIGVGYVAATENAAREQRRLIVIWNDEKPRTQVEVLGAFDDAITMAVIAAAIEGRRAA